MIAVTRCAFWKQHQNIARFEPISDFMARLAGAVAIFAVYKNRGLQIGHPAKQGPAPYFALGDE